MSAVLNSLFYVFLFLSLYVQVFLLVTFIENRKKIVIRKGQIKLGHYPTVTVMVPCWNEEKTVARTVESLLAMNYPKDKLTLFVIDDGSTDSTWSVIQQFNKYENVRTFTKENGGKHTALNLGLKETTSEFVACLDADSFADPESLIRIMSYFEATPDVMAVSPSVIVESPQSLIQKAQKAEYDMSVYIKKMLGFLGAIHVTPGPLTVFKKKVFDDLGPYRKAHNTEDMEIAYRMQKNGYKIEQCNDAYIYTNTPKTVKKLFKQRVRWIYGFINNTIDYRRLLFKKKYGHFSFFTVPAGIVSIISATYLFGRMINQFSVSAQSKILALQTTGIYLPESAYNFDLYFFNTGVLLFITVILFTLLITSIIIGKWMSEDRRLSPLNILYFIVIYSVVAPFWLMKALYNTIFAQKPSWR
ncbi:MAG: glycosyltransferase family 2 protein [Candidatus Pacebacteria bacterium]|nr:glycosyltransferase family 2 protein [Candidatus Paceibacterota bacterium]MBP9851418.1 glycosyltransferase family 2 protein [Candidatus Paceibacterota bacterium]